jgi:hypothetical protein
MSNLHSHIHILQPDRPAVVIVTHNVTMASKMLDVHFSPASNLAIHIEHMVQEGLECADCLRTMPLSCRDAWLSFYLQLFPAISWGIVKVCLPPQKLDTMIQ